MKIYIWQSRNGYSLKDCATEEECHTQQFVGYWIAHTFFYDFKVSLKQHLLHAVTMKYQQF